MKLIKSVAVLAVGALALVGCDSRQKTVSETEGYSTRTEAREMLDTTDTATGAGTATESTDSSSAGAIYAPSAESERPVERTSGAAAVEDRSSDAASGAAVSDSSELDTVNANEELGADSEAYDEIDQQAEEEKMLDSGVFDNNQFPDNTSSEPDPDQMSR